MIRDQIHLEAATIRFIQHSSTPIAGISAVMLQTVNGFSNGWDTYES
ncbi:MAG: hypothetical protein KDA96_11525 [Planctomycetaceae bacterium]|nr:hypothetical protein [Planctomycetaceae bacterium]